MTGTPAVPSGDETAHGSGHPAIRAGHVDREAILSHLKLNPRDPATQALLLVCERYGLDPLLRHMILVDGRPYITRDGLLDVAHRSGQLDGIEVLNEGDDADHWWAKVAVYRKDMSRPFVYRGRYPHNGGNKRYGPEMAVKVAEVAALRRAFQVTGIATQEESWEHPDDDGVGDAAPPTVPASPTTGYRERALLDPTVPETLPGKQAKVYLWNLLDRDNDLAKQVWDESFEEPGVDTLMIPTGEVRQAAEFALGERLDVDATTGEVLTPEVVEVTSREYAQAAETLAATDPEALTRIQQAYAPDEEPF